MLHVLNAQGVLTRFCTVKTFEVYEICLY